MIVPETPCLLRAGCTCPETMRQIDYAARLGINRNTLKQWVRAGIEVTL